MEFYNFPYELLYDGIYESLNSVLFEFYQDFRNRGFCEHKAIEYSREGAEKAIKEHNFEMLNTNIKKESNYKFVFPLELRLRGDYAFLKPILFQSYQEYRQDGFHKVLATHMIINIVNDIKHKLCDCKKEAIRKHDVSIIKKIKNNVRLNSICAKNIFQILEVRQYDED